MMYSSCVSCFALGNLERDVTKKEAVDQKTVKQLGFEGAD